MILDDEEDSDGEADTDQEGRSGRPPKIGKVTDRVQLVIGLAEKYFDRFETAALLELLPRDVSVASLLHYFQMVLEYGQAKKRNLQVRPPSFPFCDRRGDERMLSEA